MSLFLRKVEMMMGFFESNIAPHNDLLGQMLGIHRKIRVDYLETPTYELECGEFYCTHDVWETQVVDFGRGDESDDREVDVCNGCGKFLIEHGEDWE